DNTQRFHFVEVVRVLVAFQGRRGLGAKELGTWQSKRSDEGPMGELRLWREIGRCGLVITRFVSKYVRNWRCIRAVVASQGQGALRNGLSDSDTLDFCSTVWNRCQ